MPKIKYGLSHVAYAKCTIATNGTATYGTPVDIPGAVNLTLDAESETEPFYADNIVYYTSVSNNGYSGSLEVALIPDSFMADIFGDVTGSNGLVYEKADVEPSHFALLFQFENDSSSTRHVFYNCVATRPSVSSQTKEASITPVTETMNITANSIYNSAVSASIVKGKAAEATTAYGTWYTAVVQPS